MHILSIWATSGKNRVLCIRARGFRPVDITAHEAAAFERDRYVLFEDVGIGRAIDRVSIASMSCHFGTLVGVVSLVFVLSVVLGYALGHFHRAGV